MYSGDKDILAVKGQLPYGTTTLANIEVLHCGNGQLSIRSLGGQMYSHGLLAHVYTIHDLQIWKEGFEMKHQSTGKPTKLYGLQENESNLLSLLDPNVVSDIMSGAVDETESTLPDLEPDFNAKITSSQSTILQDIIGELVLLNPGKWMGTSIEDLFPDVLQNGQLLNSSCTMKDLQAISRAMENNTGRCWFSWKLNKWQNVNMIVSAFNSQEVLGGPQKSETQKKNVPPLHYMCRQVLLDKNYPSLCVQSSYANAVHQVNKILWDLYARTEIMGYVPNQNATEVESVLEYFRIPEFSVE